MYIFICFSFFFSSRRRHTRCGRDWSSDVCSSDLPRIASILHELHRGGPTMRRLRPAAPTRCSSWSIDAILGPAQLAERVYVRDVALAGPVYEIGRASCRERG